jgi:hypothetical protein
VPDRAWLALRQLVLGQHLISKLLDDPPVHCEKGLPEGGLLIQPSWGLRELASHFRRAFAARSGILPDRPDGPGVSSGSCHISEQPPEHSSPSSPEANSRRM